MMKANLPYSGFWISWHFFDSTAVGYEDYLESRICTERVFQDIEEVLRRLIKYELLIPTYLVYDNKRIDFGNLGLEEITDRIKELVKKNIITYEIDRIGGYGVVYFPEGEKKYQEDLVLVDSIRFFERRLSVQTSKSIWVPMCFDDTYELKWQIEESNLNGPRLESALTKIRQNLSFEVEPSANELVKENPIWQKGFKLYVNPSIIIEKYRESLPDHGVLNLEDYLKEIGDN